MQFMKLSSHAFADGRNVLEESYMMEAELGIAFSFFASTGSIAGISLEENMIFSPGKRSLCSL